MSHYCPSCQRVLYSRRLTHCGYCGAQIPEELRFTPEEIAVLDREREELEAQRKERARLAAEEEAARRRAMGDDGVDFSAFM